MQRRKLVATAGILSATAFATTVAIGAAFGLVGQAEPSSRIGRLGDQHRVAAVAAADARTPVAVTTPALGPKADD
jgi:hypothetical protein